MFDHLDDPEPIELDEAFRAATRRRGERLRRSRHVRQTMSTVMAALVLVCGLVAVDLYRKVDSVERVDLELSVPPGSQVIPPINVLVTGVDDQLDGGPRRTDTILIVRIDRQAGHVGVLSIPRDLLVDVTGPPAHRKDRINTAIQAGGPQALIAVIDRELGIPIHHYVQVTMPGFMHLVDTAGGVGVRTNRPLQDTHTGLSLATPGCHVLNGAETLALVRARYLQWLDDRGTWIPDGSGDVGRMDRTRVAAEGLAHAMLSGGDNPIRAARMVDASMTDAVIDASWTRDALLDLMLWARTLKPEDVATETLSVTMQYDGEKAVFVMRPDTRDQVERFLTSQPIGPSDITTAPGGSGVSIQADPTCR